VPIIRSQDAPSFELPGIDVTGYAAPARGSSESTTYRLDVRPGEELPKHRHDHEEIVHVLAGPFFQVLDEETFELQAGDTAVIPAGTLHYGFATDAPSSLYCAMPAGTLMQRLDGTESVPPWGD
jgi:quercetin dioxygenase-like cupin family protein